MKVPIPDDWQEEQDGYILGLVCIPNSQMWRSLVRGKIQELARGRIWDETTGSIKAVQTVGWAIYDSFMTCKLDDLVEQLETLNITVAAQTEVFNTIAANLGLINGSVDGLPSGDVERAVRMLTAAIASENMNLTGPLPDSVDYSTIGLATRLAPTNESSIATRLQNIYQKMSEFEAYVNELEEMQHAISSVLGYTPGPLED